ncbi:MAG: isoprenylcysteine carboxylmethyltransferase family protein [Chloroflexi bacterium]|nr:MAG: isoprenylcysteine carboxylmethyltransferase family protein [Chloroflexota bacterium]
MNRLMKIFLIVIAPIMAVSLAYLGVKTLDTNLAGWFLLLMSVAYILGIPLYFWKKRGEPRARREETGDRSFWLVQPGFLIAIFGAPIEYLFLPGLLPRVIWMQVIGLLMLGISVALHSWARQAIRGQFSGHLQIQPEHRLVKNGPYRYIRHPAYLGYLLMALGIAISYSSLISIGAVLVLLLPGLAYRMRVEEKLLAHEFGDEYQVYAQKTQHLIPGLW